MRSSETCSASVRFGASLTLVALCAAAAMAAQPHDTAKVAARVGEYVERYYARAQSILVEERVMLQPLAYDLSSGGLARRLVYELRIEWNPKTRPKQAIAIRELIRAAGRPLGPPRQPDCLDPRAVSPEPLAFLLPERQQQFRFSGARPALVDGRQVVRLDYAPIAAEPPHVEWDEGCGHIELPGRTRGSIWADAATGEILRLDEHLIGMVDIPAPPEPRWSTGPLWFTVERTDTSTQYRPVRFEDPDETLMLPARIDHLTIIRNSGVPRLRTTRSFANYRRFVTGSRLIQ